MKCARVCGSKVNYHIESIKHTWRKQAATSTADICNLVPYPFTRDGDEAGTLNGIDIMNPPRDIIMQIKDSEIH